MKSIEKLFSNQVFTNGFEKTGVIWHFDFILFCFFAKKDRWRFQNEEFETFLENFLKICKIIWNDKISVCYRICKRSQTQIYFMTPLYPRITRVNQLIFYLKTSEQKYIIKIKFAKNQYEYGMNILIYRIDYEKTTKSQIIFMKIQYWKDILESGFLSVIR